MATIAENLQTIQNIKQDIKTAIENKGVTVGNSSFTDYPTLINNIPQENTGGDITLTNIDITINGTYTAPDGEGYKTINVDVPTGGGTGKIDVAATGIKFGNSTFTEIPDIYDFSNVTDMSSLFLGCKFLQSVPMINTSNVTNMEALFQGCSSLQTVPHFDTSNVKSMFGLFNGCSSLISFPAFDTSKITSMGNFCVSCTKLKQHPQLNIPNVTYMATYFLSNITTLTDAGGWLNLKCDWNDNYGLAKLPNLTYDSCINILNGLYDFRGNGDNSTTRKLKVHNNFLTTVTEEDLATAIAKGWTLTA